MHRCGLALSLTLLIAASAHADVFDRYTNTILSKAPETEGVQEVVKLTPELVTQHGKLLPTYGAALVIVKTNEGRNCKLSVQIARQKTANGPVPIAIINRFATLKDGDDRSVQVQGQNMHLYNGFVVNLDLGQIVPTDIGGDVKFVSDGKAGTLEPVGKAKLYLVTKHLPGTELKEVGRPVEGKPFEAAYFNGTWKLFDDGRRLARLFLKVDNEGNVSGEYVSETTGRSYEVYGQITNPKYKLNLTVKFPQSEQTFQGWMFTQEGKAICGSTQFQGREFGWYATREEKE